MLKTVLLKFDVPNVINVITLPFVIQTRVMMIPSCQMLGGGGSTILILQTVKTSCCSGLHYFTTSFNRVWIEVLRRFKSCSWCVGGLSWWELPANAPDVRDAADVCITSARKLFDDCPQFIVTENSS